MGWQGGGGWSGVPPQIDIARIIDVTDTEALLVRKDADGGDVLTVDTTNAKVIVPIGSATHPGLTITDKDGSLDNGFYMHATDANVMNVSLGGVGNWRYFGNVFGGVAGNSPGLVNAAASAIAPTLVPNAQTSDFDTGIGSAGADILSLIAGGVEALRLTETGSVAYPTFGGNANAQALEIKVATTEVTGMTGATVTATNLIPAASLVLGVTVRVTTLIEGGDDFDIGDGADVDAWGAGIAYTGDTTTTIADFVTTGPLFYPSTTSVVLTQNGAGTFTAGACRITVHYISLTAATS